MFFFVQLILLFSEINRHVQNNTCDSYVKISVREKDAETHTDIKSYHEFNSSQYSLSEFFCHSVELFLLLFFSLSFCFSSLFLSSLLSLFFELLLLYRALLSSKFLKLFLVLHCLSYLVY